MLSRSAMSLRAAVTRPAAAALRAPVSGASLRAARAYSTEAEKKDEKAEKKDGEAGASEEAKKIAELEAQVQELKKDIQYVRADYQTLTRRSAEEKAKASEFAITSFARALLSTSDVLATALKHVPESEKSAGTPLATLVEGVELTQKALLQTLAHHGVTPMDHPVGQQFDPNHHEAIFQVPAAVAPKKADGGAREPGEVFELQKSGWLIKDRVLRPAQVGVVQIE